jgi:hypothetical protein
MVAAPTPTTTTRPEAASTVATDSSDDTYATVPPPVASVAGKSNGESPKALPTLAAGNVNTCGWAGAGPCSNTASTTITPPAPASAGSTT